VMHSEHKNHGRRAQNLGCAPSSESGIFFSSPASWNSLPAELHTISDTSVFKNKLKPYIFKLAFNIH